MAEFRYIHSRIWTDAWFCELELDAKVLFIYLFSNPNASICGMYEMPKRNMALDTGIPIDRVSFLLGMFTLIEKVYYEDGLVWVVNLKKYNDSGDNVKIRTRIKKDLDAISDCDLKRRYYEFNHIPYPETRIPYPETRIPYPEKTSETDTEETETKQKQDETETDTDIEGAVGALSTRFETVTGMLVRYPEKWLISCRNMFKAGVTPDELESTINKMKHPTGKNGKVLTVAGPWSCEGMAIDYHLNGSGGSYGI